jgi:ABC-type antimicrobial peptide transport system permease subunit
MLGDLDRERFTQVVVIGTFVARELYEPGEQVLGSTVSIKGVPFTVVGILKHYKKGYQDNNWMEWKNKVAYVPISTMQRKLIGSDALTWLNVQVGDVAEIDDAIAQMNNTLLHTHRGIRDFRVETKQEMVAQWQQAETTITYAMGGVAAISLLIGGIGITNVMLASINERIREIGIRKAVGARPWDVFNQFIAEAVALSLMGGLLGLLASAGLIQVLKIALASVEMVPTLSPKALLIGFSFSAGMGVLAGVYPAIRDSRLDPIDALRYE